MNFTDYLSQVSIGYPFYGVHSPAPLGSVAVSLDRDFFSSIKKLNTLEEVIILRRLAQYDKAIQLILDLLRKTSDTDFLFLELAHNYYLKGDISLGREALNQVENQESEIFSYLKAVIFDNYTKDMCSLQVLISNPLLFLRSCKLLEKRFDDDEFFKVIIDTPDPKKTLIILSAIEAAALSTEAIHKICSRFGGVIEQQVAQNHKFIDRLIEAIGFEAVKEYLDSFNVKAPCPDIIYSIFSQLPEQQSLFDSSLIVHESQFMDIDRSKVMRHMLLSDHMIKDRNTSDNGTRFYSLNLKGDKDFVEIEKRALLLLKNYVHNNEQFEGLLARHSIDLHQTDVWFDMSVTYGLSKIDEHIHTAATGEIYLATLVWYAHVPEDIKECEGNINISTGGVRGFSTSISPKSNEYVIFPPWFKHGTSPTDSMEPRVTFNFDLLAKLPN